MSNRLLVDLISTDTVEKSTGEDGTADVRVAAAMVAEAGQMLDTLTRLAARQRENLSAAERLLEELYVAQARRPGGQ